MAKRIGMTYPFLFFYVIVIFQMKLLNKIVKCSIIVKKVNFCPNSILLEI